MSQGVEWGVHCAAVLGALPEGLALTAGRLAEFHGIPTAYLAKHLQAMSRAGLIEAVQGPRGGYRLARPAADITMLDVIEAIEGRAPAFRCTEIRQRGPAAVARREYVQPCGVHRVMAEAEEAWRSTLRGVTVADVVAEIATHASPRALTKGARWLAEVFSA